jgi:hypothetical protein
MRAGGAMHLYMVTFLIKFWAEEGERVLTPASDGNPIVNRMRSVILGFDGRPRRRSQADARADWIGLRGSHQMFPSSVSSGHESRRKPWRVDHRYRQEQTSSRVKSIRAD